MDSSAGLRPTVGPWQLQGLRLLVCTTMAAGCGYRHLAVGAGNGDQARGEREGLAVGKHKATGQ